MADGVPRTFTRASDVLNGAWPSFMPQLQTGETLNELWMQPLVTENAGGVALASTALFFEREVAFSIPGVDAVSLRLAGLGTGTVVPVEVQFMPEFAFRIERVPVGLQFSRSLLQPVRKTSAAEGTPAWEVDSAAPDVVIELAEVGLEITGDGDINFDLDAGINLPPAMIGDTGIVIEAQDVALFFGNSAAAPGQPAGAKGVGIGAASLYLPGELGEVLGPLSITDAFIGNGGFTGAVATTFPGGLSAELFGMTFRLDEVEIAFVQNGLTASRISGQVTLPFFDEAVAVEIAINLNGTFSVKLVGPDGLYTLNLQDVLEFRLDSLGFKVEQGKFTALMSGTLTPELPGVDLPGFQVDELSIDSDGNVHIDGGWIDLKDALSIDFHGFSLELSQFGLGTEEDGRRWIGLSGALKLVEGLKAGASVKGLRVSWTPGANPNPSVSFEGIGVEFEVPQTLRFKGEVSFSEFELNGEQVRRFDGAISLDLLCINTEIDAELVIGSASGPNGNYTFLAIYLAAELPAGIPLWATGLALYGMQGLFAMNMGPNKLPDEPWYGLAPSEGWYKRPEIGVTDLSNKWQNEKGSWAVGAGITIGTLPDNGYTFNGRMLFAITFPGPVLLIEGKANILKDRASLGDDPLFRALIVLDFRAGDFLVGIDAAYKVGDGGELIDIGASAEMYFSFSDPSAWYLYLGQKEPRERRIRARILSLWRAESYYMLDNDQLAFGAWTGYDGNWSFGPLRVTLEAWLETNVAVSWRPAHFHGDLWAHGKIDVRVFGFGFGLSLDAFLEGDVFDPFHILARLSVEVNLPWPLPDFSVSFELEWGPEPDWPLPPLPVKEVAIEHFKVGTAWPLPRTSGLLLPNYLSGDGLRQNWDPLAFDDTQPPPDAAPVVPVDARPRITFSRAVHDVNRFGVMVTQPDPARERIGDPTKNEGPIDIKYELMDVKLQAWRGGAWATVAEKGTEGDPQPEDLYGSWAPTPALPDGGGQAQGQTKLWLWSKNPFDYTRRTGREWEDWISGRYPDMPCYTPPEQDTICWGFANVDSPIISNELPIPGFPLRFWKHLGEQGPFFIWQKPNYPEIGQRSITINLGAGSVEQIIYEHAFCLPSSLDDSFLFPRNFLIILFEEIENNGALIHCFDQEGLTAFGSDFEGGTAAAFGGLDPAVPLELNLPNIRMAMLIWNSRMCIERVCLKTGASQQEVDEGLLISQHNVTELERWSQLGMVLDPDTNYRLRIETRIDADASGELSGDREATQVEFAFFQTEGAPGLASLSIPEGAPDPDNVSLRNAQGDFVLIDGTGAGLQRALSSELNTLSLYVDQTLPVTVPGVGQDRSLPRPVYRGYDVSVEFNEDYVSQMYAMSGRDLSLSLFDTNNRPVRDAAGRIVTVRSDWARGENLLLDHHEATWVETVNSSSCGSIDAADIPHDQTLGTSGLVLRPDFTHTARLVPLLLHETFTQDLEIGDQAQGTGGRLGRWQVQDDGTNAAPSTWRVDEDGAPPVRFVEQTSNLHSNPTTGLAPAKPGTVLFLADRPDLAATHPEQPSNWTDYRLSLFMRSTDNDAIGVIFRRDSATRYYRLSMDRERRYRRLTRHLDGAVVVLGEDDFTYREDQDYEVVVEAIGDDFEVYVDGERVFRATDAALPSGGIGLYTWASDGARFSDIRVDDFRTTAQAVYGFDFTTSIFTNFAHQLHSFEDETWQADIGGATIAAARSVSVGVGQSHTRAEARDWNVLRERPEIAALHAQPATETELTVLRDDGAAGALLMRTTEPLAPDRTSLTIERTDEPLLSVERPGLLKLTGITQSAMVANDESIALIARDAMDLNGMTVEHLRFPGPMISEGAGALLFEDDFEAPAGRLFTEQFGENALDLYEITAHGGPANFVLANGRIEQTSNTFDGAFSAANLAKRGVAALFGDPDWRNVTLRATLNSGDNDSIGLILRYQDASNYLRFEMNQQFGYRRLTRMQDDSPTVLWQDDVIFEENRDYQTTLTAFGDRLVVLVDGAPICSVDTAGPARGRAGLWCWANDNARFAAISVDTAEVNPLIWQPATDTLDGFEVSVAADAQQGPPDWQPGADAISQLSNAHVPGNDPSAFGTMLTGGPTRADVAVSVHVTPSDNDAVGIAVRVADDRTYYRFSVADQQNYRRLVKVVDGSTTVLWQQAGGYPSADFDMTLRAVGTTLTIWLAGQELATVEDGEIAEGQVALYSWASQGVTYANLTVLDAGHYVGRWQIVDAGAISAPSVWDIKRGQLSQTSNLHGGLVAAASPIKPGTMALAGKSRWSDYRISAEVQSDDDDAIGLVVRYRNPQNYYYFAIDAQRDYRRLVRVQDGVYTTLWNGSGGFVLGDVYRMTIDAVGDRLIGYIGGARLFDVIDGAHANGRPGLYAWGNTGARFLHCTVAPVPVEARALLADDFTAPALAAWTIVDEGNNAGPSDWSVTGGVLRQDSNIHSTPFTNTNPNKEGTLIVRGDPDWRDVIVEVDMTAEDNDGMGLIFGYQDADNYFRFHMDRERQIRQLVVKANSVYTELWQARLGYELGQRYRVTISVQAGVITGYLDGILMFEADAPVPVAGRAGLWCWAMEGVLFERFRVFPSTLFERGMLDDNFAAFRDHTWNVADEGNGNATHGFTSSDGALTRIAASDDVVAGTVVVAGSEDWTDYAAMCVLRATANGRIGLEFRRSGDTRYRFSVGRNGVPRLQRITGANATQLWSGTGQLASDTDTALAVVCHGARISLYLNGDPLTTVIDVDGPQNGGIALFAGNNATAQFRMARVALPQYVPLYRFSGEEPVEAGTRIRIRSGSSMEAFAPDPLELDRFITPPFEAGVPLFGTGLVDLRISRNDGPEHARRFLPEDAYAPVPLRRVMNESGTALILLADSGDLPSGSYRLTATYARNSGPSLPRLSERGETGDETVRLEFSI